MKLYNIKEHDEQVSFAQAIKQGLGRHQGLFFPLELPEFSLSEIDNLLQMDFISRSACILAAYIGDELSSDRVFALVKSAFVFPAPVVEIDDNIAVLELFHGPTLAFKDFGSRLMAQMLTEFGQSQPVTILTATSGDTGAAVAQAFYKLNNIRVVILYPYNKISKLQEKLFCTLGNNIHTVAVDGDFDTCQALVKQAFEDEYLRQTIGLNSANSINISRLLAQICYYFEAVAQLALTKRNQLVISVPSGNFGNLTAGLMAKTLGLPVNRFIAATNANDTVPRYLNSGIWQPHQTITTMSNAMDVSQPNNWPRVEELFLRKNWQLDTLDYGCLDDHITADTIHELAKLDYISEPHAAIAYRLLKDKLKSGEYGLFLGTAHPAKFKDSVERILDKILPLPPALAIRSLLPILSVYIPAKFSELRKFILSL